jgi:hypothetical protein
MPAIKQLVKSKNPMLHQKNFSQVSQVFSILFDSKSTCLEFMFLFFDSINMI